MSLGVKKPSFTPSAFKEINQLERRLRQRLFNILENRLRREQRDTISVEDVRDAYAQACKELTVERPSDR